MKNKGTIITIAVLLVIVMVESVLLITGTFTKIPKNANGEDIAVSLNDGTSFTVNDIYNELKKQYALSEIINMVDSKILNTEYANKKAEVDEYANSILNNLKANYDSDEALEEALQNYGYNSVNDYLEVVKTSKLQSYATDDYAKTLITNDEVKKYYDEKYYADMSGVHVLVKPTSSSQADQDAAKKKAQEIIDAIKADVKKGTDIKEAFKKYADDKTVTYEDLGTFNYSQMDEAFSKAAYALKVNEMSSTPCKSSFGYHVILKTGEVEKKSIDDAKEEILTKLASEKTADDTTLQTKAMVNLRNKYGLTINDSEIKTYYDRYINRQLNQTTTKASTKK